MKHLNLEDYAGAAFDFEGTIADTIGTHTAARQLAFDEHGYGDITQEQHDLGSTYGSSPADILGGVLHAVGKIEKTVSFKEHPVVQQVLKAKVRYFKEAAAEGFVAMPGAIDFVRDVASRYPGKIALVTSSRVDYVTPFLERYELTDLFLPGFIVTEETVEAEGLEGKPAPDPYLLTMRKLGAKSLVVFEDSVPGVASAKKAGATVVALGFDRENSKLFESGALAYPPDVYAENYTEARKALNL